MVSYQGNIPVQPGWEPQLQQDTVGWTPHKRSYLPGAEPSLSTLWKTVKCLWLLSNFFSCQSFIWLPDPSFTEIHMLTFQPHSTHYSTWHYQWKQGEKAEIYWPRSDFSQQAYCSHYWVGAISWSWKRSVNGETALLWQKHGLHCLYHLLRDWELIKRQSLLQTQIQLKFKHCFLIKIGTAMYTMLIPQILVCWGVIWALSGCLRLYKLSCTHKKETWL